jgi:hypothetical protein
MWPDPNKVEETLDSWISIDRKQLLHLAMDDGWGSPLHFAMKQHDGKIQYLAISWGQNRHDDGGKNDDIVGSIQGDELRIEKGLE